MRNTKLYICFKYLDLVKTFESVKVFFCYIHFFSCLMLSQLLYGQPVIHILIDPVKHTDIGSFINLIENTLICYRE